MVFLQSTIWKKLLLTVGVTLLSPLAQAHDNSLPANLLAGLNHPLSGVDHLISLALIGLLLGQLSINRQLALGGFLLALGLGTVGGIILSTQMWIEAAILFSLPVFFILLWAKEKIQLKIATTTAAMFMVAHGWSHGAEISSMNLSFIFGLLLTSVILMSLFSLFFITVSSRIKLKDRLIATND